MKNYSGKEILITGGLGFIGSNLARSLVKQGANVTLVDSLIPQYGGNTFNIDDIQNKVVVNVCDVRDTYADVADLVRDFDYKPSITINQGVAKFIEWYKNYYNV